MGERLRVLYFGMSCAFSDALLAALVASPCAVVAVVVPGRRAPRLARPGELPLVPAGEPVRRREGQRGAAAPVRVLPPPDVPLRAAGQERTLISLAWSQRIPVLQVASLADPATIAALANNHSDVIAVACFPWRLPPAVLALPRLGALNVHPSLLPANRGPTPLFWTFRLGEQRTGVTVHLISDQLDAGDIVGQEAVDVPEGLSGMELEERCAAIGGRLLTQAIAALAGGTAMRTPQDAAAATYHPWPSPADFVVTPERSARWAFSFVRGVAPLGYSPIVFCGGEPLAVETALGYEPNGVLEQPCQRRGNELWLRCTPGVVRLRLAPGCG